jgi:Protein of unknown function (DUF1460)
MTSPQPRGLSRRQVDQLLTKARDVHTTAGRIDACSRRLLGHPYIANPLIGSADTAEVFAASLDGFDCVTYIETILALARACSVDDFVDWLRKIRYERGLIQWDRRNHYITLWIRNNLREGIIKRVSMRALSIVAADRVLNTVAGLAARRTRIKCIPKREMPKFESRLQDGDLIFFLSTRRNLDVFHAGIVARGNNRVLMRHASRSQGQVVEQDLNEFVKSNRMTGVIAVRPQ